MSERIYVMLLCNRWLICHNMNTPEKKLLLVKSLYSRNEFVALIDKKDVLNVCSFWGLVRCLNETKRLGDFYFNQESRD